MQDSKFYPVAGWRFASGFVPRQVDFNSNKIYESSQEERILVTLYENINYCGIKVFGF